MPNFEDWFCPARFVTWKKDFIFLELHLIICENENNYRPYLMGLLQD
jgi:hypothetical protein